MAPLTLGSQLKQAVGALNRTLRGMLWNIQPARGDLVGMSMRLALYPGEYNVLEGLIHNSAEKHRFSLLFATRPQN